MPTTKRAPAGRKDKTPPPTMTLVDTAEVIAEATDVEDFDQMVARLFTVRALATRLEERRKAIYAEVKVRFQRGTTVAYDNGLPSGGYFLREVSTPIRRYRTVESAVVKKAHPELWEAARVRKQRVSVKAPEGYEVPDLGRLRMPPAGATLRQLDMTTLTRHYKAPVFQRISELRDEEKGLAGQLIHLGDEGLLDDDQTFADGWALQLARLEFDGEKLRKLNQAVWDRLAVEKVSGGSTRVILTDLSLAQAEGEVELDGEEFAE